MMLSDRQSLASKGVDDGLFVLGSAQSHGHRPYEFLRIMFQDPEQDPMFDRVATPGLGLKTSTPGLTAAV